MKRGDIFTVAVQGDHGKPRPSLVIQGDGFLVHSTVTLLLITRTIVEAPLYRLTLKPTQENGLRDESQVQIDKIMTVKKEKIGSRIGHVDAKTLRQITERLAVFLGFS